MNTQILIGAVAVGLAGLLFFFAVTGKEENSASVESVSTTEQVSEVSLPNDLPANIPMYPGAVLTQVQDQPSESTRNVTLTFETPDTVADVNAWYRGALSESPWAITSDKNVGGYILLKGENDNVAVFTQSAARSDLGVSVITQRIQIK